MSAREPATAILSELRRRGFTVKVEADMLVVKPGSVPPDLAGRIRANRDALLAIARVEQTRVTKSPDSLESLREFAPSLWQLARVSDGREGIIWGITAHGVLVSLGVAAPILTLSPLDVVLVED